MRFQKIAAILAMLLLPGAAQAAVITYKCTIPHPPARGGISKVMYIFHDPATGEAAAIDGLIYQKFQKPIMVKVSTDNASRLTLDWTLRDIQGRMNSRRERLPGVQVTVTILKGSLKLIVHNRSLVGAASYGAEGQCVIEPPKR